MDVLNYVIKRILQMIPVFLIATIIVFALVRAIPGDPARVMLGDRASQEAVDLLRHKMGLDKSIPEQFWIFFKDMLHLDFGTSMKYKLPVGELLISRLACTALLALVTVVFTVIISFILGYVAGMKKGSFIDLIIRFYALFGLSAPSFWIGLVLLDFFALKLKLFPVSGWGETMGQHLKAMVLPALTSAIYVSGILIRNLRSNVIDISKSDYVDFAISKGISPARLSIFHVVRNALIPATTLLSLRVAVMLSGSVVLETVFTLPGLGNLLVNSIYSRDYPVVQGVVMMFVVLVMLINLITDILYSLLDPRVKLQ
ncbi:MAG: ABC transporter permease [Lachnospiraceae bacterium]|nr:ABC transporter permease [Lachnospiraceae bacterium]